MEGTKEMGKLLIVKDQKSKWNELSMTLFMMIIGFVMIIPFIFMLSAAFKSPAMITDQPLRLIHNTLYLRNFISVFTDPNYFKWYINSIGIVSIIILLRVVVVTMAGYAFARLQMPFKNVLFVALMGVWMIPPDTTIVSRYLFYKYLHLLNSPWSIIFNFTFDVFMLFLIRQFFMQIPKELTEAAIVDGCSHLKIYYKIMLPLTKPVLLTMILFTFIWVWNSYIEPFIFIDRLDRQMLTVGLQFFGSRGGQDIGKILAGATIGTLPTIFLFSFAQRYFIQGIAMSGIKG